MLSGQIETVLEDENKLGKFFSACNSDDCRFPSGCKGKPCLPVVVAMIEAEMIKTRIGTSPTTTTGREQLSRTSNPVVKPASF